MARCDVMPVAVEASLCDCVAYFLCNVWLSKKCSFFCIVPYMCWCVWRGGCLLMQSCVYSLFPSRAAARLFHFSFIFFNGPSVGYHSNAGKALACHIWLCSCPLLTITAHFKMLIHHPHLTFCMYSTALAREVRLPNFGVCWMPNLLKCSCGIVTVSCAVLSGLVTCEAHVLSKVGQCNVAALPLDDGSLKGTLKRFWQFCTNVLSC